MARLSRRPLTARGAAWLTLDRVEAGARLEAALAQVLDQAKLSERDRALAGELAYGVCRWRSFLDHALAQVSRRPLVELDAAVLAALRLGAHQLLRLDRIPARAAVHATVEEAKSRLGPGRSGFVNAVLRALTRQKVSFPDPGDDFGRYLAVKHSHPDWLVARWLMELGPEAAEARLTADNEPPGLTLRVNRLHGGREEALARLAQAGLAARPGQFSPLAVLLPGVSLAQAEAAAPGWFTAQAEAAQLVGLALPPWPQGDILDLCAGAGGKTTHLAELAEGPGRVTALDLSVERLAVARRETARLHLGEVEFIAGDALDPALLAGRSFAAALLDAPCTGSGVLAARPDLRWRLTPADPARLASLQARLLEAAARLVQPGGVLVYATCSLFAEENEGVVQPFLAAHPEFQPAPPTWEGRLAGLIGPAGLVQTRPEQGLAGFFIARLVKSEG